MMIHTILRLQMLASTAAVVLLATVASAASLTAMQTGPHPVPFYAGGMTYDPNTNLLYVTGATYMEADDQTVSSTSNCFIGVVRAPTSSTDGKLQWIQQQQLGTAVAEEACFGVTLNPGDRLAEDSQSVYIVGTAEESGLLTDIRPVGSTRSTQYGTLLNLGFASNGQGRLYGGYLMHEEQINYPVAIVADKANTQSSQYIYLVAMTSKSKDLSVHYKRDVDFESEYPNLTRGGPTPKFGKHFELFVQRLVVHETEVDNGDTNEIETLLSTWRKSLATAESSVLVTGVTQVKTSSNSSPLLLSGSAQGSSSLLGDNPTQLDTDKWSGFLLVLDPEHGTRIKSKRFATEDNEHFEALGICTDTNSQINEFVYLVGATSGVMAGTGMDHPPTSNQVDAVVVKVRISDLEIQWTQQFRASDPIIVDVTQEAALIQTTAVDCIVSKDGSTVYIGGIVEDGMVMDKAQQSDSAGWDDIWIASMQTASGDLNWMQQVGSDSTDRLAYNGALALDNDENLIIFGDTTGSFYRRRDPNEPVIRYDQYVADNDFAPDLFLLTMDSQGNFLATTSTSGVDGHNEHSAPTEPPLILETAVPVASPVDFDSDRDANAGGVDGSDDSDDVPVERFRHMTALFAVALVVALVACCIAQKNQREKEIVTERSQVFAYLQSFDVEDVDLRHSATGGWHGTYVNNLAHGVNRADPKDTERLGQKIETAPLTHSSIVRDSLFVDVDSRPSLSGSQSSGDLDDDIDIHVDDDDSSAGYDGLVGAYNDLQPRSYSDRKSSLSSARSSSRDKPWGKEII